MPAALAAADEASERAAVEKTIAAYSVARTQDAGESAASLFSSSLDAAERSRLLGLHRALIEAARRPMSETTVPKIVPRDVRFVTSEVALVDASTVQFGSLPTLPGPGALLFVMRKEAGIWRILAIRRLAPDYRP